MMNDIPTPGSTEAIKKGCTCPVVDNNFGEGEMYQEMPMFITCLTCPVHVDHEKFLETRRLNQTPHE